MRTFLIQKSGLDNVIRITTVSELAVSFRTQGLANFRHQQVGEMGNHATG